MTPQEIAKSLMNGELPPELERAKPTDKQETVKGTFGMMQWVVDNLSSDPDKLTDTQIPNDGCRELLRWARTDMKAFWPMWLRIELKATERDTHLKSFEDNQRRHFVLLDRVLANWERRQADAIKETAEVA